jgi:hypothetical protein
MEIFKVYFEIFGKKMQCELRCNNKDELENLIKNKIKIHKVEKVSSKGFEGDESLEKLKNMFGFK